MRDVTDDDLWSAIHDLRMFGMTKAELLDLRRAHLALFKRDGLLRSAVIVQAAEQVARMKVGKGSEQ